MSSRRRIVVRGIALGLFVTVFVAGAFLAYVMIYTRSDRMLPGVHIGQADVGGLLPPQASEILLHGVRRGVNLRSGGPAAAAQDPVKGAIGPGAGRADNLAAPAGGAGRKPAQGWEKNALQLRALGRTWLLDRTKTGPVPDVQEALRTARSIGREGPVLQEVRSFLTGWIHGHHIPIPLRVGEAAIRERLGEIAREIAISPINASYDFATNRLTPDVAGQELDVDTSLELIRKALLLNQPAVDLVVRPVAAGVQASDLINAQQYQLTRFTTPILSADPGRVHNISLAIQKASGVLLKPGEVFSFNDIVGPRDAEHGWSQAKEIYQGEFVLGYGGGICQVSSTLYNAILLAGLEVKERYHHERPLEYVRPGRDATVAWKLLDFRFRNNRDTSILIGARVLPGEPQQIEVTIHGQQPLTAAPIRLEEADVKYLPPELVEVPDASLPEGERRVVDEGHYGIEIKLYRHFGEGNQQGELVSHDRYQPKAGKVRVGVGNGPGSQRLLDPGLE